MEEFQKYFFQTTFHHYFQARKAKISPISILTGETMVGFVIFCVLRNYILQEVPQEVCSLGSSFKVCKIGKMGMLGKVFSIRSQDGTFVLVTPKTDQCTQSTNLKPMFTNCHIAVCVNFCKKECNAFFCCMYLKEIFAKPVDQKK